jgi:hypothetical protein
MGECFDKAYSVWNYPSILPLKKFPNLVTNIDINLLKPTGYVMNQRFKIQLFYALPTPYSCVMYLSENKQRLVPPT